MSKNHGQADNTFLPIPDWAALAKAVGDVSKELHLLHCALELNTQAIDKSTASHGGGGDTNLILQTLSQMENRLMATIAEFSNRVNSAFDAIGASVDGIVKDVQFLKDKITELQNNPGPISPADQLVLDALEARAIATVANVASLDAATETPPTP